MWVSDDVDGLFTVEADGGAGHVPPAPGWRRTVLTMVLVVITVFAVGALLLWGSGAFSSAAGGCGG